MEDSNEVAFARLPLGVNEDNLMCYVIGVFKLESPLCMIDTKSSQAMCILVDFVIPDHMKPQLTITREELDEVTWQNVYYIIKKGKRVYMNNLHKTQVDATYDEYVKK